MLHNGAGGGAICWSRPAVLLSRRCEGDSTEVLRHAIVAKSLKDTVCCGARRPNGTLAKLQAGSHAKATRRGSCSD
jgi:hypothetical protein